LKPLAVYKLSRVEAALRRLDAAVASLEGAASSVAVSENGAVVDDGPVLESEDVVALRLRCDDLSASLRAASLGVDVTVSRLKLLLDA